MKESMKESWSLPRASLESSPSLPPEAALKLSWGPSWGLPEVLLRRSSDFLWVSLGFPLISFDFLWISFGFPLISFDFLWISFGFPGS